MTAKVRIGVLAVGLLAFILPALDTENRLLYTLAPWVFLSCFLYFTRTAATKRDWILFWLVCMTATQLRFKNFMGDSEPFYILSSIALNAILAVALSLPFVIDRYYQVHGSAVLAVAVFPFMRILVERLIPGQQFNLSLTQFDNKWLLQSVTVMGEVFLTFMVAFVPSLIVWIWLRRSDRRAVLGGCIALFLCALVFAAGGIRYMRAPKAQALIRMAYASGPGKTYYEDPTDTEPGYAENEEYLRRTVLEAAGNGAKLIAYAEEAYIVSAEEEKQLLHEAEQLANENSVFILLGLDSEDDDGNFVNKALLINDQGNTLSEYVKTNLIPIVETEDYTAGNGVIPSNYVTIDGQQHVISYTICFDATFSAYLLAMNEWTDLFINPSWDWEEIDDLNYRMQGISAVACGVVLFKPTVDGWSIVTDPYGRVSYKESTLDGDYDRVYYADVPTGNITTFYERYHNLLTVLWSGLTLVVLLGMGRVVILSSKALNHRT